MTYQPFRILASYGELPPNVQKHINTYEQLCANPSKWCPKTFSITDSSIQYWMDGSDTGCWYWITTGIVAFSCNSVPWQVQIPKWLPLQFGNLSMEELDIANQNQYFRDFDEMINQPFVISYILLSSWISVWKMVLKKLKKLNKIQLYNTPEQIPGRVSRISSKIRPV